MELKSRNIKFKILLPDLYNSNERARQRLISLYNRWKIDSFVPLTNDPDFKKVENYFNITQEVDNKLKKEWNLTAKYQDKNWHQIIPFSEFNADYEITAQNLRETIKTEIQGVFELEEQIRQLLNNETSFSPFKNKSLSHIIMNELYLNSVQHAYEGVAKNEKNCYLAIVLNNKRDIKSYAKRHGITEKVAAEKIQSTLGNNYRKEKCKEEQPFFFDKERKEFRNESFVEFSFLDFGKGIPNSLREKFLEEIEWGKIQEQLSDSSKKLFAEFKNDSTNNRVVAK